MVPPADCATAPSTMVIEPVVASTSMVPPPVMMSPAACWITLPLANTVIRPLPDCTTAESSTSWIAVVVVAARRRMLPAPFAFTGWLTVSEPLSVTCTMRPLLLVVSPLRRASVCCCESSVAASVPTRFTVTGPTLPTTSASSSARKMPPLPAMAAKVLTAVSSKLAAKPMPVPALNRTSAAVTSLSVSPLSVMEPATATTLTEPEPAFRPPSATPSAAR